MALVGIGIDRLDLAFLYINEAVRRLAGLGDKRPLWIRDRPAHAAQCLNVRRGEWSTLHLA
jgi:hypothetical protein